MIYDVYTVFDDAIMKAQKRLEEICLIDTTDNTFVVKVPVYYVQFPYFMFPDDDGESVQMSPFEKFFVNKETLLKKVEEFVRSKRDEIHVNVDERQGGEKHFDDVEVKRNERDEIEVSVSLSTRTMGIQKIERTIEGETWYRETYDYGQWRQCGRVVLHTCHVEEDEVIFHEEKRRCT